MTNRQQFSNLGPTVAKRLEGILENLILLLRERTNQSERYMSLIARGRILNHRSTTAERTPC